MAANLSVNVNQVGGTNVTLGQKVMASSFPVVLASDQASIPVAATLTAETTKVIGTVNQGTSPWIVAGGGSAGSAATGVVTVQGIASMTKLLVTPDSVALPANQSVNVAQINGVTPLMGSGIMGTGSLRVTIASDNDALTVKQATAANLNAAVVGTGTAGLPAGNILTVQGVASMTKLLVTPDSVALPANQSVNVSQINAVTPLMGNGVTGTGSLRVTIASDNTANSNPWLVSGAAASGAAKAGNPLQMGGVFNTTQPTVTTGQAVEAQFTNRGAQIVATGADTFNVTVNAALPTGANVIGALSANQSVNVAQINGVAPLMGAGNTGTGSPRVTIATDQAALANWGTGATGAAVPSGAQYNAGLAQTALPVAATAGNLTGQMLDKFGRQVVIIQSPRDLIGTQRTTISNSTAETTIVTAGVAGVFNDVIMIKINNTSATATRVDIRDATLGTIIDDFWVPAGDMRGISLNVPYPQTTAANNWTAQCSVAVTDVRITVQFIKNK